MTEKLNYNKIIIWLAIIGLYISLALIGGSIHRHAKHLEAHSKRLLIIEEDLGLFDERKWREDD